MRQHSVAADNEEDNMSREKRNTGLKQEITVYAIRACIWSKEDGPMLGIFTTEAEAQAVIDRIPPQHPSWLRVEPVIVGRTAGYRKWLTEVDGGAEAEEGRARDEGLDEFVDQNPGHETEVNK